MIKMDRFFDRIADTYDKTEEKRFEVIHLGNMKEIKKHLNSNDIVLDFGCATGTKALEMSNLVKKMDAIDISARMIEIAGKRAAERSIENIRFKKTTIFDECFQSETYDVVSAFNIIHLLENDQLALQRINDLLKPGGLFISNTICLGEKMTFLTHLQFSIALVLIKTRVIPSLKRYKFNEIENLIVKNDFKIIESEQLFHDNSFYFCVAKKN